MTDWDARIREIERLVQAIRREHREDILKLEEKNIRLERELIIVMNKLEDVRSADEMNKLEDVQSADQIQSTNHDRVVDSIVVQPDENSSMIESVIKDAEQFPPPSQEDILQFHKQSPKAKSVILMILRGYSTEQMIERTGASHNVIRSRLSRVFVAFRVRSRQELRAKMHNIYVQLGIDYTKEPIYGM